jgi:UDP-galactopyranose mutase
MREIAKHQLDLSQYEVVIVGAGLFGLTMAERITSHTEKKVLVIEKRSHFGGNSYSYIEPETGIEVHKYGTHLFHTSNEKVWEYVNKFTSFTNYQHKVFTRYKEKLYPMPINLETINKFYDKNFTPSEAFNFIQNELKLSQDKIEKSPQKKWQNLEEKAISLVGRDLYNAFIREYTAKQWETDPKNLPAEIITRLPFRFNLDQRYFSDTHEGLPTLGYFSWINRMLTSSRIDGVTNLDFHDVKNNIDKSQLVIYTGSIDSYFDFKYGYLGWRTIDFDLEIHNLRDFQGWSVINYAEECDRFTRIHEYKHLHPERKEIYEQDKTIIAREFSRKAGKGDEPYYPINTLNDKQRLELYRNEIEGLENVIFGGRLGSYQYLDMHMAVASALSIFEARVKPKL